MSEVNIIQEPSDAKALDRSMNSASEVRDPRPQANGPSAET